ncbi:TNF receptor-associated factor 4-like [Montipora foliosa]|uniref:TNF receptor-associated factor 4-like n=1 Tax=Montipora foliosa TaxID=591990 RepID=UPI0035F11330
MAEVEGSCALGGYDEEFVDDIEDDWLCPICHLPLKVPVQTGVCGHRFCKLCLERHFTRQEADGQELTCPLDQNVLTRDKDMFLDKATERKVRSFVIKCPRGCQWTGELRSKEDHESECRRLPVNCPNGCGELVPREEILLHTEDDCSLASIPCPYAEMGCNEKVPQPEIEFHLNFETRTHLDLVCTKLKNTEEELRNTKDHLDLTCAKLENTEEELKNTKEGLDLACTKLENTEEELKNTKEGLDLAYTKLENTERELRNTKDHLDLACTKLKNTEEELRNTKEQFKETTKKHEERINALENKPFIYTWKIDAFQEVLKRAKAGDVVKIHSDPFYSSECGYKARLRLYPNGSYRWENTHLSIYLVLLKGDFDSLLKWPFAQQVTFTLIDQQKNLNERENITKTDRETEQQRDWNSRPLKESNVGRGFSDFVPHDVLIKRCYILDDTIFIQAKFEAIA